MIKIEHKIVKQYQEDTHNSEHHAEQLLCQFHGNAAMAKASEDCNRWARPLAGIVYVPHYDDDRDWEYHAPDTFESFDKFFWKYKYYAHQEVHLTKDGKLDCREPYWDESISVTREREERIAARKRAKEAEVAAWKPPTVADIINSSVDQFIANIKFRDQVFKYKFSQSWLAANCQQLNANYHIYAVRKGFAVDEDEYFINLQFPMGDYMKLNNIDFDGNRYTFNGKSVLLKDLIGDEKQ